MIKNDYGIVTIEADDAQMMVDLTLAIRAVRETLTENFSEDIADRMIVMAGRLAYVTEEEFDKGCSEMFAEMGEEDGNVRV